MYYDSYRKKNNVRNRRDNDGRSQRKPQHSLLGFLFGKLFKLNLILTVLIAICVVVIYIVPSGLWNIAPKDTDLALNGSLSSQRLNVLLMGLDELDETQQRTDTIIIMSVGSKDIRLVSVQRDTMVDVPGYGRKKINAAYNYGGAEMLMRCVNQTFGMNITRYIAVDYVTLVKMIDAAGGIDIEINDAELEQMNYNVGLTASIFKPLGYSAQPMTQSGSVHLNGLFALGYSRIRNIDSDYMRTFRQRTVIMALMNSIKKNIANPLMFIKAIYVYLNYVDTNLSIPALVSIAEHVLMAESVHQTRTPDKTCCADDGSGITITDPEKNRQILYSFLYDEIETAE